MPDPQEQTPTTTPPAAPASAEAPLSFDHIPGHESHGASGSWVDSSAPTFSAAPSLAHELTRPATESEIQGGGLDPVSELGKALEKITSSIENYTQSGRVEHPVLSRLGDVTNAAKELLFGGQAAGHEMGTKEGLLNNPITQMLTFAEDAPETLASVESGLKGAIDDIGAHPAFHPNPEHGGVPLRGKKLNFDDVPGHQDIDPLAGKPRTVETVQIPPKDFIDKVSRGKIDSRTVMAKRQQIRSGMPPEPAKIFYDKEGNVVGADGRHRALAHMQEATPRMPVEIHREVAENAEVPKAETAIPENGIKSTEVPDVAASAQRYNQSEGRPEINHTPVQVDENRANRIAATMDAAKHEPTNPAVAKSYAALKSDVVDQWHHAQNDLGITFEPSEQDPYSSHQEMMDDITKNHRLKIFTGGEPLPTDHPLATVDPETGLTYNTIFRGVHDLFGHGAGGHDFSEAGEASATAAHRQMMSPEAVPAMLNETEGQTSQFFRGAKKGQFQEQKATILSDSNYHPDLQKMADVYPPTEDASGIKNGASFITPDGKFMHLPADHPSIMASLNVGDKTADDARVGFINDTGAVRTRFSKDRAGDTLHVSVPKDGPTPEQVNAIKQAVGKVGRYGNLVMETATNPLNIKTATQGFATPGHVDDLLHQIEAHPDGQWYQKAAADMAANGGFTINPRTGEAPTKGYAVEVGTEQRKPFSEDKPVTAQDIKDFHAEHKDFFDRHPELHIGGYKGELNITGIADNLAGAKLLADKLDQKSIWDFANGQEIPTGGTGTQTKFSRYSLEDRMNDLTGRNVAKLPPTIKNSAHLTDDEKYLLGSHKPTLKDFQRTKKKIASAQDLAETMKGGEANRFWYERAKKAFDTMFDVLPQGSFPQEDRNRFISLVAATSPRVDVVENVASALKAYRSWVQEGRPSNPNTIREVIDSSLMMPGSHGPNAVRALTDQPLSGPKVSSFVANFMGSAKHVTNDMWGAITNGIVNPSEITSPGAYIALSENYRKAAESLGWTPQQGQAASWGFIRTLGNASGWGAGKKLPAAEVAKMIDDPMVRKYSADIADIFLTSEKVRGRLQELGIDLEKFDAKLTKSIEPYGRGGEGKAGGLDPRSLARTARRVEGAKDFAREQAALGKTVNEKAMPLLDSALAGKPKTSAVGAVPKWLQK